MAGESRPESLPARNLKTPSQEQRTGDRPRHDLVVFICFRAVACSECGEIIEPDDLLRLLDGQAVCLSCADLDHLEFLASGDAALTRRAIANSTLHAVVVKWSKARRRNERQGILVEPDAIAKAEELCQADEDVRAARGEREAVRRAQLDRDYVEKFAAAVVRRYPGCPHREAARMAEHACEKYSGRVGRTTAAKAFDTEALDLAVVAHVRHAHTRYDSLLASGRDRHEAREEIRHQVNEVLTRWRG